MYLPYLRGKQYELLAIRNFAESNSDSRMIVPIIEPVRNTYNSMAIAVNTMMEHGMKFCMILNPSNGDFEHNIGYNNMASVYEGLTALKDYPEKWTPAYIYGSWKKQGILLDVKEKGFTEIMVVFTEDMNIADNDVNELLKDKRVKYVVDGNLTRRKARKVKTEFRDKAFIRLDSCFNKLRRSTDYTDNPDESFSEAYLDFREDGLYGFSDYTALAKDFSDGGMLPSAVAIHLTYEGDEEIRIHHFVSDSNSPTVGIKLKFLQAAGKVISFYDNRQPTSAVVEIRQMVKEEKYPGLGYLKKLSIVNHLELVDKVLKEQE